MEKSNTASPKLVEIDLYKLTLPELSQQKNQLDQEIVYLQDSIHTLKMAQNKFQESKRSIEKAQKYTAGQPLLVPLTGSMYVDGQLAETDAYIIDVGTGYYIRKNAEGAKDYFQRRLSYLSQQIEAVQGLGFERSMIKEAITGAIRSKIEAQLAQQQAKAKETE